MALLPIAELARVARGEHSRHPWHVTRLPKRKATRQAGGFGPAWIRRPGPVGSFLECTNLTPTVELLEPGCRRWLRRAGRSCTRRGERIEVGELLGSPITVTTARAMRVRLTPLQQSGADAGEAGGSVAGWARRMRRSRILLAVGGAVDRDGVRPGGAGSGERAATRRGQPPLASRRNFASVSGVRLNFANSAGKASRETPSASREIPSSEIPRR